MEAAGIEPASGSLRPLDPTCVVRALVWHLASPTDGLYEAELGRSHLSAPKLTDKPARIMTALPQPTGRDREDRR